MPYEFCQYFDSDNPCRVVAFYRNLKYDLSNEKLRPGIVLKFIHETTSQLAEDPISVEAICCGAIERDMGEFLCKGSIVQSAPTVARIMSGYDFIKYHTKSRGKGKSKPLKSKQLSKLLKRFGNPSYSRGRIERSFLRGKLPVAWVTDEKKASQIDDVDTLRSTLGLNHVNEDDALVMIEYPKPVVDALTLHSPTFLDGQFRYIYRSSGKSGEWGQTVNLETLSPGLPEAIHRPILVTDKFRFKFIGAPENTPPQLDLKALKSMMLKESKKMCASNCPLRSGTEQ